MMTFREEDPFTGETNLVDINTPDENERLPGPAIPNPMGREQVGLLHHIQPVQPQNIVNTANRTPLFLPAMVPQANLVPTSPPQEPSPSKKVVIKYNCGLRNCGNTCYIGSCLQALNVTNSLRVYLAKYQQSERLHVALSKLFYQMSEAKKNSNENPSVLPSEFIDVFRSMKPQFIKHQQHDAQEFLSILIDLLHNEVNRPLPRSRVFPEPTNADQAWKQYSKYVDKSVYSKIFVGQMESCLKCLECSNQSLSWSCFWQIPLHLSESNANTSGTDSSNNNPVSIVSCLRDYAAVEVSNHSRQPVQS